MIVSRPTFDSIWRSTATLTSRFSTMTSITRPTPRSGGFRIHGLQPRQDCIALAPLELAALHATFRGCGRI
jgi:hypothetical protein